MKKLTPYILVFLSGFAGLVYQVLWMRQLGLLFGNTSYAAAATLAAFFGGLAAGSWFWGRRVAARQNPLLDYAWLEVGIAVTALLYFAVLSLFYFIYPAVYRSVVSGPLLLSVKLLLAILLVFPPAFFMGGTIPVMGQALIHRRDEFGVKAAWLYAINTMGAALGAFTAAFFLVRFFGFRWTCILAMTITGLVAATVGRLARGKVPGGRQGKDKQETGDMAQGAHASLSRAVQGKAGDRAAVAGVCFLSGFGVLALEVLWTRLLAQIHTNSVYSFAAVLVTVLLALAMGAAVSSRMARWKMEPMRVLACLLLLGGLSVAASPFVVMAATNSFQILDTSGTLLDYIRDLFGKGTVIAGVPAFILGMVFPFLMKAEECNASEPGFSLGRLSAINTLGAIVGSLLCGFAFLEYFGMWRTMQLIAALYLVAAMVIPTGFSKAGIVLRTSGAVALLLLFTWASPAALPVTGWDPGRPEEELVEVWETSDCTVSVVLCENDGCVIKVNSNYRLGSTGAAWREHFQGRIPLLVYPGTRSVFFLGVGTGISAGGALDPRFRAVKRVVACDLVPEVVNAAKKYMTGAFVPSGAGVVDFTSGLFNDKRVEIVIEDGRHYLMASGETFDMVNADLFLPYRSGAGSLYSREHFENVKASLNPGGVFVQWIPMFQVTETEFGSIARTMLDVFDRVTMWRNNFDPGQEVVGLMGHRDALPLPACSKETPQVRRAEVVGKVPTQLERLDLKYDEETALLFYCGNLTAAKELFLQYPLNTDDRPVVEYSSPLSIRQKVDGFAPTLVGPRYEAFIDKVLSLCPPDDDPMLVERTSANRRLVTAGAELHRFWLAKAMGDSRKAENAWVRFVRAWTDQGAE